MSSPTATLWGFLFGGEVTINGEKLKQKLEQGKARQAANRRAEKGPAAPPAAGVPRPRSAGYRGQGYDSFGEFVASGDYRRLIVRPDGRDGGSWTLKGVLVVRERSLPVYMHGVVDNLAEVLPLIDRLLRKGEWHEDRYPSKEDL